MKTVFLSLFVVMTLPLSSFAKVEDFNAMINESEHAQTQLRKDLKGHIGSTHQAQMNAPKEIIEVASEYGESVNSPTKKSMLTFEKEMVHYRPSETRRMKRLANEIKASDKAF
ncbi:MAG TPA: hypothetical protein VIG33_06590 [Pseudobdellovibrionaceae bacterium]|jgi:hypothetical protein